MRTRRSALPSSRTRCPLADRCVYGRDDGYCDDPQINKGNSDAACHRIPNRDMLERFDAARRD